MMEAAQQPQCLGQQSQFGTFMGSSPSAPPVDSDAIICWWESPASLPSAATTLEPASSGVNSGRPVEAAAWVDHPGEKNTMKELPAEKDRTMMQRTPAAEEGISIELVLHSDVLDREEMTRAKEEAREAAQVKTYTRWVNSHLKDGTPPIQISDLVRDLRNGVVLINLLHRLYDIPLPHYHHHPNSKIHALDNVMMAFHMLEQVMQTSLPFLKPANIVDGDQKMVMGMLWTLILDSGVRMHLTVEDEHTQDNGPQNKPQANMHSLEQTANSALLAWCQERTQGYPGVNIKNFTDSFSDGMAFFALLHSYDPSFVNFQSLDPARKEDNLLLAFAIAEDKLGIPQLLDVSDFSAEHCIDARSVITYLSEFVKRFETDQSPETQLEGDMLVANFPQPVAPPLPPRLHTQQQPSYNPNAQYCGLPPPGYSLAQAYSTLPQPYQAYPPIPDRQQQTTATYRSRRSGKKCKGRALIERAYLW